jgi:Stress up-regulated Nod 19
MLRPPQGKKVFSFESHNMKINQDGYILTRRGHLHDGGENIDFLINGKSICDSKAIYGGAGQTGKAIDGTTWETVSEMGECSEPFKVKKGDNVTVIANYNLEKHPARQHAMGGMAEEMGLMNFAFAVDNHQS